MPRDIPVGNGNLLVAFDRNYLLRDLYFPCVGKENHTNGHPFRIGFWVDGAASGSVTRSELERHRIRRGERILLKTLNSEKKILQREAFTEEFVYVEADAADYLVARSVRTIGLDYLSIGGYKKNGCHVHMQLLGAGILILEGLDLSNVPAGRYDMICLPIKIFNGDGAPARVLLKNKKTTIF